MQTSTDSEDNTDHQTAVTFVSPGARFDNGCRGHAGQEATGRVNSCDQDACTNVTTIATDQLKMMIPQRCHLFIVSQLLGKCVKHSC